MGTALKSCLYDCEVVHKRLHPKKHEFRYRLFYFDIDLDELSSLKKRVGLVGTGRFSPYAICAGDHLDVGEVGIRENLAVWLKGQGTILHHDDRVRLLTMPRVCGYIFNPVCFYFIFDRDNHSKAVVVEVCNTFRELKPWLITKDEKTGSFHLRVPKHFYVSPFSSLKTEFDFRVPFPGESLKIHIDDIEDGTTNLVSWIHGERRNLNTIRLMWYSFRFPFLGLVVILRIHYQAMLLWLKKIPHYQKGADPALQKDLYRPHSSISEKAKEKS